MVTSAGVVGFLESIVEVCSLLLRPRLRRETSDLRSGDGGASASLSFLGHRLRVAYSWGSVRRACCRAVVLGRRVQFGKDDVSSCSWVAAGLR